MGDLKPQASSPGPSPALCRRSVSLPLRSLASTNSKWSNTIPSPDPKVETLFAHQSVRIVCFLTDSAFVSKTYLPVKEEEEAGTLPWASPLERVIAVGPLRIYRAPGSVAFLSCGGVIQAIFPKSRCWCVDDASTKFVLQMRRPQYWRIELPDSDPIDLNVQAKLKQTLSQILQFEKTACPFQREFTVELPELPANSVKKRPWRPIVTSKQTDVMWSRVEVKTEEISYSGASDDNRTCENVNSIGESINNIDLTPRNLLPTYPYTLNEENPAWTVTLQTSRSGAAPPQLTLITSPLSKSSRTESPTRDMVPDPDSGSDFSSSVESFHTIESWHSPISPLPLSPPESNPTSPIAYPYSHGHISLKNPHRRDSSNITITAENSRAWDITRKFNTESAINEIEEYSTPPPRTPSLIDDIEDNLDEEHFEIATPPTSIRRIRHRPTTFNNSRRALSPLPPVANIFSPSRQHPRRSQTTRHLPTAIIQKTCEILLSPPSHLIHLMLDIASKITAGEWRGIIFGLGERGEKIVGQWDYEDDNIVEDDYGISLGGNQAAKRSSTKPGSVGGSWEID